MCVCVHVNNPCLTVSHAVSLTVPTNAVPVGANPFDDDEDEEEEIAEEQQTTVNHISVNKEEIKKLVKRRKHSIHLSLSPFLRGSPFMPRFLSLLCLSYSAPFFPLSLLQVTGCCVAMHGHWDGVAHRASVCLSFIPNSAMSC